MLVFAGCVGTLRQFQVSFPPVGATDALPGVVNDQTGLVTRVAAVPPDPAPVVDDFMTHDPRRPNVVVIQWLGGGCDARVDITVENQHDLSFVVSPKAPAAACDAVGAPHAIKIELSVALDASRSGFRMDRGTGES